LKEMGIKVVAIPNIEISRYDELEKHRYFDQLWCNNIHSQIEFLKLLPGSQIQHLGFSPSHLKPKAKQHEQLFKVKLTNDNTADSDTIDTKTHVVRILFMCGWNGTRRGIEEFWNSFQKVVQDKSFKHSLHLTVLAQSRNAIAPNVLVELIKSHHVTLKIQHFQYEDILKEIDVHHAVVNIAHNEGLGLSLYEATARSTPVISIDIPPNNEVIWNNVNGWTVPIAYQTKIEENPQSLVMASYVNKNHLCETLIKLGNMEMGEWIELFQTTLLRFTENYSSKIFSKHFKQLIDSI